MRTLARAEDRLRRLNIGLEHQRAGRLSDAFSVYRAILAEDPTNVDALHLLGALARQRGQLEDAFELIRQAIKVDPTRAPFWNSLGTTLSDLGRPADALACFDQSVAIAPGLAEAHYNRGSVLLGLGRRQEAVAALELALEVRPEYVDAHLNLGNVVLILGNTRRARVAFQRVLELRPGSAQALNNMGTVCRREKQFEAALDWYARAIEAQPGFAEAYYNRGSLLLELGRTAEAVAALERCLELSPDNLDALLNFGNALMADGNLNRANAAYEGILAAAPTHARAALNLGAVYRARGEEERALAQFQTLVRQYPDYAEAHNNLAGVLLARDDVDAAIDHFRRAIALSPTSPDAYANLGLAFSTQLRLAEAMEQFEKALELEPEHPHARWCRAANLLLLGDMEHGWAEYEWRWQSGEMGAPREFAAPRWQDQSLAGCRLLVWAEQGLGDTLQFARYTPLLARQGVEVVFEVHPELERLVRESLPEVSVIRRGAKLPKVDFQVPLLSLPRLMGTLPDTIPNGVPYLTAPPSRIAQWAERLGAPQTRRRVGLVWSGNRQHKNDRRRSIPLELLTRLAPLTDIEWVCVQPGLVQKPPLSVVDHGAALTDVAETAALLMNLDLVISVDTSVAHLAGALGRPVWVLLPYAPDWRWLLNRSDTPWYPSARLFRQPVAGAWSEVVDRVVGELH